MNDLNWYFLFHCLSILWRKVLVSFVHGVVCCEASPRNPLSEHVSTSLGIACVRVLSECVIPTRIPLLTGQRTPQEWKKTGGCVRRPEAVYDTAEWRMLTGGVR